MRDNRRLRNIITRAAVASALILATMGITATPAFAVDNSCTLSGAVSGAIGVPQTITLTSCATISGSVPVTINYPALNVTQTLSVQVYGTGPGNGGGSAPWNPNVVGVANLTTGSALLASVNIVPVSTTTVISASNTAKLGTPTSITAIVQSASPSVTLPLGSVTFKDANGNTLANIALQGGATTSQAIAVWTWVPPSLGNFIFNATYNPSNVAGQPATTGGSSTTTPDIVLVTPSGSNISLTMPPQVYVSSPTTLTATVFPTSIQGSAGFTVNGQPISPSVPLVNGVATFTWTPTVQGQAIVGANFTSNGGQTGSTSNVVTVGATTQSDVITLTQPGFGTWSPNGSYQLGNGTSFAFQASTLSGAAVTLTETGPCQVSGLSIVVDTGSGQCNLVASSAGGNGYTAVKQGYTVITVPGQQSAILAAPLSGRVNVGRTLTLESPAQGDTNAGTNIVWKIKKGKGSICALAFPSSGAVKLKIKKRGQCTVKGSAPGVTNAWAPYRVLRTYQGR